MNNNADDIPQSERRRIMTEERRAKTYFGHAQHTDDDIYGGRFAKVNTTTVVGAGPISYPTQPANSPWASEPIGPEPFIDGRSEGNTLGFEIDHPDVVSNASPPSVISRQDGAEHTPTPASSESHVISDVGVGSVAPGFTRRF